MKTGVMLNEYVKRLPDGVLYDLRMRIKQNLSGDRAVVANILAQDKEIDKWLSKATDADDFFDMLELVGEYVMKEYGRRDFNKRNK